MIRQTSYNVRSSVRLASRDEPLACRPASVLIRLNPAGNIGNGSAGNRASVQP